MAANSFTRIARFRVISHPACPARRTSFSLALLKSAGGRRRWRRRGAALTLGGLASDGSLVLIDLRLRRGGAEPVLRLWARWATVNRSKICLRRRRGLGVAAQIGGDVAAGGCAGSFGHSFPWPCARPPENSFPNFASDYRSRFVRRDVVPDDVQAPAASSRATRAAW